jgi:hypothetical protein
LFFMDIRCFHTERRSEFVAWTVASEERRAFSTSAPRERPLPEQP